MKVCVSPDESKMEREILNYYISVCWLLFYSLLLPEMWLLFFYAKQSHISLTMMSKKLNFKQKVQFSSRLCNGNDKLICIARTYFALWSNKKWKQKKNGRYCYWGETWGELRWHRLLCYSVKANVLPFQIATKVWRLWTRTAHQSLHNTLKS